MPSLQHFRLKRGLTMKQLAELSGVSIQSISSIERGGMIPTVRIALKLAQVLGCTIEELCMSQEGVS